MSGNLGGNNSGWIKVLRNANVLETMEGRGLGRFALGDQQGANK